MCERDRKLRIVHGWLSNYSGCFCSWLQIVHDNFRSLMYKRDRNLSNCSWPTLATWFRIVHDNSSSPLCERDRKLSNCSKSWTKTSWTIRELPVSFAHKRPRIVMNNSRVGHEQFERFRSLLHKRGLELSWTIRSYKQKQREEFARVGHEQFGLFCT